MKVQILLEDNEQGTVNINVTALDGAEFTQPDSGKEPTNAEAMAAYFLQMVHELEQRHKAMLEEAQKKAEAEKRGKIITPAKPGLVDGQGRALKVETDGKET